MKKYVLPYFPYLIAFWFFSKCGTAYRMAAGANLGEKLFGMVKTIGPVFQSYAPGLGLLDLAVGVTGAVILYFVVQSKIKKARKFRRDMEYGSARWGTEADIKPFVDPKFENNVILTGTEFLTMNTRPKNPANARNLNACVIGSSGSGKTRFWLTPQILQAHSSYVVVDPKGGTLAQCGYFLQKKKGYKVKVFNSIDFSKSMHYNPMAYIKTESDVLKFVNALIANTKGDGKEGDEFWTKAETLLYCALVAYIVFEGPEEERNMNTLVEMINSMEVREDDESFKNAVDYMFDGLAKRNPQHFAVRQYAKYKLASGVVCSKRLLNQAVGKSLRTHNLKPKKGAQVMRVVSAI
ncbi:MAG: type IV secretory system conjugative DNA transfer family protein [Clostridiales bacterium]|nr:type IV secretory system conjugative DNA transfer family protein [Clostridiales bacterium]